jgi:xanthine dehydrogenase YagR molybdenum-binding subunit
MPNTWPQEPRLLTKKHTRIDGPDKATGLAKYSYDYNLPGMLHAIMLRCPHAHARLTKLDTSKAEKMPGVKGVYIAAGVAPDKEFIFAGEEVAAIAADTEEHARDAVRAIDARYEVLPFFVKEEDALQEPDKATLGGTETSNVKVGRDDTKGEDIEDVFRKADMVVEGEYGVSVQCHNCLESHGCVAAWEDKDKLTVYFSTQTTVGIAGELTKRYKQKIGDREPIPTIQVKCITQYMGGGYGSKFSVDEWGHAAAELARTTGKPVKLMLDRAEEATVAGNRPSAHARVRIGGMKDGTITGYQADIYGTPGIGGGIDVNVPYVYVDSIPSNKRRITVVRLNAGRQRAFRAPGHPQNCALTDQPLDDFAAAIGMDPMKVRLKNLPANDPDAMKNLPLSWKAIRNTVYKDQIAIAAEKSDWARKWHPPGKGPEKGPVKHGIGMALHTWGGAGGKENDMYVTIASDGAVTIESSTQDLGTAERTVLALVAAETLGLEVKDVLVRIGDSTIGRSTGSGGSTTCPGTAPAALNASCDARDQLFDKIAGKLGAKKEDLAIEPGKITDKSSKKSWTWKEACARLGSENVKGTGNWTPGLSLVGVCGVQVAEVLVDTETGVVRCTQVVAVQDCGLIINKLGCESQVAGGVIMAVNYALFEERIMDRATGRQVNPDLEFYRLGGIEDMPNIIVHMYDNAKMRERGVIGIGEPPTISTAAAIGNAIFNAIGLRVSEAPFTPDRVLARLAKPAGYNIRRVTDSSPFVPWHNLKGRKA